MFEVVMPLGVLLILLLAFRGFLQVIQSWMLNGTIRRAMEKQPEAVPQLLANSD